MESERISSVARAFQGARRKGRADQRQMERMSGRICNPMRLKPAAAGRRRARARGGAEQGEVCTKKSKKVELLMLSAGPPEGGFVPKPPFHREHQD